MRLMSGRSRRFGDGRGLARHRHRYRDCQRRGRPPAARGQRRAGPECAPPRGRDRPPRGLRLGEAGDHTRDLEGIVLGDGPGSFTGLRIGWAAAKGLAQEAGLSLRAVPSLMAAAAGAARMLGAVPIAACFDALRGQVYGAVYVIDAHAVATLVPPLVLTIDELAARSPQRPRVVVGDGAVRYADQVARWSGAAPVPIAALVPPAVSLLAL